MAGNLCEGENRVKQYPTSESGTESCDPKPKVFTYVKKIMHAMGSDVSGI